MKNNFLLILLSFSCFCFSQQKDKIQIDSLSLLDYNVLIKDFYKTKQFSLKKKLASSIVHKAKKENDTVQLIAGYYFQTDTFKNDKKLCLKYLDSIINISTIKPNKNFPSQAYHEKGIILHDNRNFKEAINAFTKAYEYSKKYNDIRLIYLSNYYIARLKDRIGNHSEALKLHKENISYVTKNIDQLGNLKYLRTIFAIAFTYKNIRDLDSASHYNKLGLKLSKTFDIESLLPYFYMNEGVVFYLKGEYDRAKSKINNSKEYFKQQQDFPNLSEAYFYLGKIEYAKNNEHDAIKYFKKVDTIFIKLNDLFPELRENYILLSKYYKSKQDLQQQLLYTEKLNEIDSILNSNNMYISDYLKKQYDIPKIVSEKDDLIISLEETNNSQTKYIFISIITFILIVVFFYKRQQVFKKRFEKLLENSKKQSKNDGFVVTTEKSNQKNQIDVPEELVNNLLNGLKDFEQKNRFLDSNLKLSTLAKYLQTNTNYLSKTINHYKGKNINLYLNDLRVDYAINKIQEDSKFRNYTIKAIAREVGFKSSETFSKTFYKKTGIYPSYFIKQVKKKSEL